MFEELTRTADGSKERAELIRRLHGPTWRERFGDTAFTEDYRCRRWPRSHPPAAPFPFRFAQVKDRYARHD